MFAINHMTVPRMRYDELFGLAEALGCGGVELRNDLGRPLFEGDAPETVRRRADEHGVRIVGLSQVYPFNAWSHAVRDEVARLIETAVAIGAESISLIPRNDGQGMGEVERRENARVALEAILPMLDAGDITGLVEPLGFPVTSSLRDKSEALEIIDEVGGAARLKLVHDTFHHYLAEGGPLFPKRTGIVHISGVTDGSLAMPAIRDEHRVLVDDDDRLGNVEQLIALRAGGYDGPISIEAFSPLVHAHEHPKHELRRMIEHLSRALTEAGAR